MHQMLEGVYHDGHIDIDKPIPIKNNTKVKFWIVTDKIEDNDADFGSYNLGKAFDKINIRDFAHED